MADFAELKQRVKIEDVAAMLGLTLKKEPSSLRSPCPACNSSNKRALYIVPRTQSFFCYAAKSKTGGNLIALYAHVKGVPEPVAGDEIAKHFGIGGATAPPSSGTKKAEAAARAAKPNGAASDGLAKAKERVVFEHPMVQEMGLSAARAEELGIGFMSGNGSMQNRVVIPLYKDGKLVGYAGYREGAFPPLKLHKSLLDFC